MTQPGREWSSDEYRFAFNGMEKDDEISGEGNSYSTFFRQYDPRLGRWLSVDPKKASFEGSYLAMRNNPISLIDPEGDTVRVITVWSSFLDPGHTAIALVGPNLTPIEHGEYASSIDEQAKTGIRLYNSGGSPSSSGGGTEDVEVTDYTPYGPSTRWERKTVSRYVDYNEAMVDYLKGGEKIFVTEWVLPDEVEKELNKLLRHDVTRLRTGDMCGFDCKSSSYSLLVLAYSNAGYSKADAKKEALKLIPSPKTFPQTSSGNRRPNGAYARGASRVFRYELGNNGELIIDEKLDTHVKSSELFPELEDTSDSEGDGG